MGHNSKCFVPYCNSGYDSCKKRYSMFSAPKDENLRKLWDKAICRADRKLSVKDVVCAKHFTESNITKVWVSGDITIPYKRPRLKPEAVPSVFSYSIPLKKSKSKRQEKGKNGKASKSKTTTETVPLTSPDSKIFKDIDHETVSTDNIFEELWLKRDVLKMPNAEWTLHYIDKNEKRRILISECSMTSNGTPSFLRNIILEPDSQMKLFLGSVEIPKDTLSKFSLQPIQPTNISDVQNYVDNFSNIIVCDGGPSSKIYYSLDKLVINTAKIDGNGFWRHNSCTLLNDSDRRCTWCKRIYDYFINHLLSSKS